MQSALEEYTPGNYDLVFSDVILPDRTGVQLVDELLEVQQDLKILLCSGYAAQKSQWSVIQERGYRFLRKPYNVTDLLRSIRESLDYDAVTVEKVDPSFDEIKEIA